MLFLHEVIREASEKLSACLFAYLLWKSLEHRHIDMKTLTRQKLWQRKPKELSVSQMRRDGLKASHTKFFSWTWSLPIGIVSTLLRKAPKKFSYSQKVIILQENIKPLTSDTSLWQLSTDLVNSCNCVRMSFKATVVSKCLSPLWRTSNLFERFILMMLTCVWRLKAYEKGDVRMVWWRY